MKKRHPNLQIRIEFEPNRFSSDWLVKAYEQLKPVDSHSVSQERQKHEEIDTKAANKGGGK